MRTPLPEELKSILEAAVQDQSLNYPDMTEFVKTSPEDFINDIRVALERGDTKTAQQLSLKGVEHYSDNEELKKYAYVLAPPMVSFSNPAKSDKRLNRKWLMENFFKYRGRWVAVRSGKLLAEASSLNELKERLSDIEGVLITTIP